MRHNDRNCDRHHHSHNLPSYHDNDDHSGRHHHDHHAGHPCDVFAPNDFFFSELFRDHHDIEQTPSNSTYAPQDPAPHSFLSTEIGGYAVASGTNTIATGSIVNTVKDLGNCSIAFGDATFNSVGTGHGGTSADAGTYLSVTGADIIIEFSSNQHSSNGCYSSASSEIQYLAIDIYNWTPAHGPITIDTCLPSITGCDSCHAPAPNISGNIADIVAAAEAAGTNTATSTITQALTVENHFSMVAGLASVVA